MFVGEMVNKLRRTPRVWEPDPLGHMEPWEARLQAFQDAAIGIGPDQAVEVRVYMGLDSKATPREDDYVGGIQFTRDFRPENSVTSADDESASAAFLPIFQLKGEEETLLLPQAVRDALQPDAEWRAPPHNPREPGPNMDADAPRRPRGPASQPKPSDTQEAVVGHPMAVEQANPLKRKREGEDSQMLCGHDVWLKAIEDAATKCAAAEGPLLASRTCHNPSTERRQSTSRVHTSNRQVGSGRSGRPCHSCCT